MFALMIFAHCLSTHDSERAQEIYQIIPDFLKDTALEMILIQQERDARSLGYNGM